MLSELLKIRSTGGTLHAVLFKDTHFGPINVIFFSILLLGSVLSFRKSTENVSDWNICVYIGIFVKIHEFLVLQRHFNFLIDTMNWVSRT